MGKKFAGILVRENQFQSFPNLKKFRDNFRSAPLFFRELSLIKLPYSKKRPLRPINLTMPPSQELQIKKQKIIYDYWEEQELEFRSELDNSDNCRICTKINKNPFGSNINQFNLYSKCSNTYLYKKYSSSQNYYFTKDINDMLADAKTPAVFLLKD